MKPVFCDTSYYVAFLSSADAHHAVAVDWSERVLGRMVVTEYILVELGSALSGLEDREVFAPFVQHLLADPSTAFVPAFREVSCPFRLDTVRPAIAQCR